MRSVLVIGSSGFIGGYAMSAIAAGSARVAGTSTSGEGADLACDIRRQASVDRVLLETEPDAVLLTAGQASVNSAWEDPAAAFRTNVSGPFHVLDGVRRLFPETHVLFASSAGVYGSPDGPGSMPFTENDPVVPSSPYGASKAAAEMLCQQFARQGTAVTIARSFNQIGPGQSNAQAPAEFSEEIVLAEQRGDQTLRLPVGDPAVERDFIDVRDTADAFRQMIEGRVTGVFNICSGTGTSLRSIIEGLSANTEVEVEIVPRQGPPRPVDILKVYGSHTRLTDATGWRPVTPLATSLADLLADWRHRV